MTTDISTLIAHFTTAASEPPVLPTPAVSELDTLRSYRRRAQVEFDTSPVWARGLAVAA